MVTWIILLRGINVGGNNILPMKDLRSLLERLSLVNVRTYIQSGNCVFDSDETDADMLAKSIADAIEKQFDFRPQVLVLTKAEMEAAIESNPYPEGNENPKNVHLYFLAKEADNADLGKLEQIKKPGERFLLSGLVFYLYTPEGFAKSRVAPKIERCLCVPVTARNLRSAIKISELAL